MTCRPPVPRTPLGQTVENGHRHFTLCVPIWQIYIRVELLSNDLQTFYSLFKTNVLVSIITFGAFKIKKKLFSLLFVCVCCSGLCFSTVQCAKDPIWWGQRVVKTQCGEDNQTWKTAFFVHNPDLRKRKLFNPKNM